jgi:hypothetical protein
MGFIQQKVCNTTSASKQSGHVREQSAATVGMVVITGPSLNSPHRLDPQTSTCTHPSHHLPAAARRRLWYYGVIMARHRLTMSCAPRTLLLYVCSPRVDVGCHLCACADAHIRPPDLHLRAHTVAIRSLSQCIAHARSLAVVLGIAHTCASPVSFDSTVPRDLARVGHVYQQSCPASPAIYDAA